MRRNVTGSRPAVHVGSYRDYLEVHDIGVQLTEALAEYRHRRIREELKFSGAPVLEVRLQLHPEQPTDAFVLHHPEAKYFDV